MAMVSRDRVMTVVAGRCPLELDMIQAFEGHSPEIHPEAFVHETAVVIGEVRIERGASIWPGCVLRGDVGLILIGEDTNIQDQTIIHCTGGESVTTIGPRVTVGHRVVLHGCLVEGDALIGMGAILLDNAVVEPWCIIGAGSLVPKKRRIERRSLAFGSPAAVIRELRDDELEGIEHGAAEYVRLARRHRAREATRGSGSGSGAGA